VLSRSSTPAPDPVIFLWGGPGDYALFFAADHIETFDDILNQRDLILFDQRGVGYSEPVLDCPETEEARLANIEKDLDHAEEQAIYLAALTACYERLVATGINLSAYNSATSAADLHDLRQVLGYETWNLLGISYGTRLALTAMRDYGHTGAIRSVILDSVSPPHIDNLAEYGANTERAFNLLFARYAADDACHNAYPDLAARFYNLVDTLNNEPITVVVTDRVNEATYRVPFNGDDLMIILFDMMYCPNQIIYIPKILGQLEQGRTTTLSSWLTDSLYESAFVSMGMRLSAECAEEVAFTGIAEVQARTDGMPPQLALLVENEVDDNLTQCKVWQVEATDPVENEPVVSDIPTLLLAGDYDPITPPSFAQEAPII
jgi:pimeloyl-ACP methyl ester carboxylesterase